MRRVAALLLLLPLLTGCWGRLELADLALVIALGVDLADNGLYEFTFGIVGPPVSHMKNAPQGDAGIPSRIVVTQRGRSFAGVLREIELRLPRRINLTHTLVVFIGERLAEHGLGDALDFVLRAPEFRLQGLIVMVRGGPVRTLLETEPLMENLQTKALTEIAKAHIGLEVRLWEFFSARATTYRAPLLPVIELMESPDTGAKGQRYAARLGGAAVLRGDRVALYLDAREVRAIKWLRGRGRDGVITVPCGDEPGPESVSFRVVQAGHRVRLHRGGKPAFAVALRGRLRVTEMQCPRPLVEPQVHEQLVQRAEAELRDLMEQVIAKLQEAGVDPVFFGEHVRALRPGLWRTVGEERWGETWREVPVTVSVDLRLHTTGLMRNPLRS
ncbi:Ger(x)C family spore germination protein [Symbiobacterium thermophilum]|uniref:Ger(x)C family spore germination protein n=1 Tax=Symbiobacterium thermophilum TaxID=2734 RepID=UPI0035C769A6